jgi:hypothetical protein
MRWQALAKVIAAARGLADGVASARNCWLKSITLHAPHLPGMLPRFRIMP